MGFCSSCYETAAIFLSAEEQNSDLELIPDITYSLEFDVKVKSNIKKSYYTRAVRNQ